jgi:hypothetical protein
LSKTKSLRRKAKYLNTLREEFEKVLPYF